MDTLLLLLFNTTRTMLLLFNTTRARTHSGRTRKKNDFHKRAQLHSSLGSVGMYSDKAYVPTTPGYATVN
jgi:hypothetical protein